MFATIGDLISYLFHITVNIELQTFGTLMALAFAGAYIVFVAEFKRKEADGTIQPVVIKEQSSSAVTTLLLNVVMGFILGYKGWAVITALFHGADPAPALLSWQGSWIAGIMLAITWGFWVYKTPDQETTLIHPYQLMPYITLMCGLWGFLGAKLFDAVEHFQELRYEPLKVLLARSGFTYYGGLVFGALTFFYIGYRNKIRLLDMADIGSPGMMLAYGIGRIGCQLSGDGDWGIVNRAAKPGWIPQWAWSFTYPHNAIDAGIYIPNCTLQHCHELPAGVFPTPFYEATLCILLFILMWAIRHRIKTPGIMFYLFLLLNGTERFFIEKLRITPKYGTWQLSQAQMIGLLFMIGGLTGFLYFSYRKLKHML